MANKLTNKEIQTIIQELYALDPSLRDHEHELANVIRRLVAARPTPPLDKRFVRALRNELQGKAISMNKKPSKTAVTKSPFLLQPFLLAGGGVMVGLVLAVVALWQPGGISTVTSRKSADGIKAVFGVTIDRLASNAFGEINIQDTGDAKAVTPQEAASSLAVGYGGGGAGIPPSAPVAQGENAVSADARMIAPPGYMTNYVYTYKGPELSVEEGSMDVLKQVVESISTGNLASIIQGMNFGLTDLSTFPGMTVQDISLAQQQPFGYLLNISPTRGTIYISQNWEQWQSLQSNCKDEKCWEAQRLTERDLPSDQELIRIANAFLDEHRIDRSAYGEPEVRQDWRRYLTFAEAYVPDVQQVLYPLEIDGTPVYDSSGNKTGLWVNVNIRANRVSDVSNLRALRYQASSYETETDIDALLKQAEAGGLYGYQYPEAEKTVELELGEPTIAYVQIYQYSNDGSQELQVPAYVFPVLNLPEEGGTRERVIVPLVKGVIQEEPIVRPLPMPVDEPVIPERVPEAETDVDPDIER